MSLSAEATEEAHEQIQGHPGLNATLWYQTSVEARVSTLQAFQLATAQLEPALKDKRWTASIEQAQMPPTAWRNLPPAIVLDIDETVLDNSPLQARLVKKGLDFDGLEWAEWVHEAQARPVEGAVEFVRQARARKVQVIYLSNRSRSQEPPTQRNLQKVGLLPQPSDDAVLSRFEKRTWRDDKSSRRRYVAQKYRILLLIGDDFNDFVSGAKSRLPERRKLMQKHLGMWGKKWIVVPNPLYGSWEGSVLKFNYEQNSAQKLAVKHDALQSREVPPEKISSTAKP